MEKLDNIGENEIRIIGSVHEVGMRGQGTNTGVPQPPSKNKWRLLIISLILLLGALLFFQLQKCGHIKEEPSKLKVTIQEDSINGQKAYVEISDTIINNVSLHRFVPINAVPKLVVGLLKTIPDNYILGAMAADFGIIKENYQVIGAFVYEGKMLSHSKSKYGFCALLKDTVVIGDDLSSSYFEEAIEEKGYFFRQHALVHNGKIVTKFKEKGESLRRALCILNNGCLCVIDTEMSITFDSFASALCNYDVKEAIALMGSGAAVRWAVDEGGRRYIAGADEFDFPDVVNYIVWVRKDF